MDDQQKMRASDRDRQQVVDRLRRALEDGRLTMEEYVDRMEAAYQAATYGELAPLFRRGRAASAVRTACARASG
jgi:isoaspartyl peptidase/L-asparaginase-like protein (Ntn-hydrolase superfamily)